MKVNIKNTFFLILIILFTACSSDDGGQVPETVLPQEEMAGVLADIHILDAAMSLNISSAVQKNNDSREETTLGVLKKHNLTKEQFDESFRFYSEHPELLGEVYKLTLNKLSELQAKVANEKDTVKTTDSLSKDSVSMRLKRMVRQDKLIDAKPRP
jgi:hypothetical protein